MKWTKVKPTKAGFYWVKMRAGNGYSGQEPAVRKFDFDQGDLCIYGGDFGVFGPEFEVSKMDDQFEFSDSPVEEPMHA